MCSFHYSWFSKENRYWKEWSSQNNWWGVQVQILMLCIHTLMGFLDMPFSFWPFFFFFFNLIFVDICCDWICYFCMIDTLISSNFSLSASSFAWQSCPSSSHDFFLCNILWNAPEKWRMRNLLIWKGAVWSLKKPLKIPSIHTWTFAAPVEVQCLLSPWFRFIIVNLALFLEIVWIILGFLCVCVYIICSS